MNKTEYYIRNLVLLAVNTINRIGNATATICATLKIIKKHLIHNIRSPTQ